MGKGPNKKDYAASEAEQVNAQIGRSEYERFKTKFAPLLKARAAESQTDAVKTTLRGRAQAEDFRVVGCRARHQENKGVSRSMRPGHEVGCDRR